MPPGRKAWPKEDAVGLEVLTQRFRLFLWKLRLVAEEFCAFRRRLLALWIVGAPAEESITMPQLPRVLRSPRRTYLLDQKIAAGDLCDVYLASAGNERFVLKAPRASENGAESLLTKEMAVLWELTHISNAHYRLFFPEPVETIEAGHDRPQVNVLAWNDGFFTAGEIITRYPAGLDGRHLAWMFKRMLAALGFAHRQGWIHGAVTPPHLLFHAENHGLLLIDWIHAVGPGEPLTLVPAEFKEWYPPECRYAAEPASDIYLAAKSIVHLAGGDASGNLIPDHVPRPMRAFFEACLLESPRMRPHDAWELHEEFDELLGELYGAPQYVRLSME
jgi:hypothetical protein